MLHYAIDIAKYVSAVDQRAVQGIVDFCGVALRYPGAWEMRCHDPDDVRRVCEHYAVGRLGLDPEAAEQAIAAVCRLMAAVAHKPRVTFYYLVAARSGRLAVLHPAGDLPARLALAT